MIPSGWYDDPANPGAERYWDGTQWTEHTRVKPSVPPPPALGPPGSPPAMGQPGPPLAMGQPGPPLAMGQPGPPMPLQGYGSASRHPSGKINDLGDWINRSFSAVFQRIVPLSILCLVPVPAFIVTYLIADSAVRDVVIQDGNIDGYRIGLLIVAAVCFAVGVIMYLGAILGQYHQLYGAVVGQPPAWQASLATGFRRLPMMIGVWLLVGLGGFAVFAISFFLVSVAGPVLLLLIVPLFFVLFAFGWVKLSMVTVAVVTGPSGSQGVVAGWRSTEGYFWPIFGRLFLLGFMVNFMSWIAQLVGGQGWPSVFGPSLTTDPLTDELLINGQRLDQIDQLVLADVLPNPLAMIALSAVLLYLQSIISAIGYAGDAALYADTGGANSFGHRRR